MLKSSVTFTQFSSPLKDWPGDAVLVFVGDADANEAKAAKLEQREALEPYGAYIDDLIQRGDFSAKKGEVFRVPLFWEGEAKNLYLAGLGDSQKADASVLRDTLASALRRIGREHNNSVLVSACSRLAVDPTSAGAALGEAAGLCGYSFDKYKKKDEAEADERFVLKEVLFPAGMFDPKSVEQGGIFAAAQSLARDVANEPGNVINPPILGEVARRIAEENGLTCEVWDDRRLALERMGALLCVGRASTTPPCLVHLVYKPTGGRGRKKAGKIALVGKGITFDSGGLNLKPSDHIKTMKGDKTGACNVLAIMAGVAALKLDAEVHGIMAVAENMPGGGAVRPDDIVRARNGKTIEIENTDAEGRLVLADALAFASELRPDVIIDIATLTGACAVALGNWTAGLFTADDALAEALSRSAARRGESLWRMPASDEKIGESLKSKVADLVNSGGRYGGATFAAMFLSEFVDKGIPWAHIDIAGVDFMKEESGVYSRGASAWGVRTCLDYITEGGWRA
ncbi:MAG: leucyl aminopeptidase [Synergistaceae bacterium]|jgi:leucyl aminopeptidase|nr:leucyl aminopeptidase [Synergistaceae bacterium]